MGLIRRGSGSCIRRPLRTRPAPLAPPEPTPPRTAIPPASTNIDDSVREEIERRATAFVARATNPGASPGTSASYLDQIARLGANEIRSATRATEELAARRVAAAADAASSRDRIA